ncbi:MAG: hypothetical protein F4118_10580 [Acidimicrobiaceae bacterium]|nr:hypothetical protein [Candidatus Poribacteria bacterium]MYI36855.1 hypothetical protein [Acidimicrobiaceae bacterium]
MNTASAIAAYLPGLDISQGALAGKPFHVQPWQRRFLHGAFKDGVAEAALTVARGAGKTTFLAGVALAHLEADGVKQPGSEITVVCSTVQQGQILFDHILRFLGARQCNYKIKHSQQVMQITPKGLDSTTVRVLGSNPGALHGAAPSLILADELAQWAPNKAPRMLSALRTGLGKIPGSKMITLGTRAEMAGTPFEESIRLADYRAVYSAGKDDPPFRIRTWRKANPSLRADGFGELVNKYRKDAAKARASAQFMQAFKALRLNMGVPDTLYDYVLDVDSFKRTIRPRIKIEQPYILGVDLGSTAAMSAVAAYSIPTGCLDVVAAFPNQPPLIEREITDGVQGLYRKMEARGELFTSGGHVVPVVTILETALARWGAPAKMVVDRWRLGELVDALQQINFPSAGLVTRGQGFKDGGEDVHLFRRECLAGNVRTQESLLLTSAISEARTVSDPAGNQKLSKNSEGGRRSRGRDDALAAAIIAVAEGARMQGAVQRGSELYYGKA